MRFLTRHLFNAGRFLELATAIMPFCAGAACMAFANGLYLALFNSPPDYQQGETVRIMYIHVPAAWMGLIIYVTMAVAAGVSLITRVPTADIFCLAAAPVGAVLVAVCLITGSIWGEPTWGAWWVWDARLTSVLVLFLLYCGYMVLRHAFDDEERGSRASAILLLVGVVNIPIVRFSVDWWNTLHQPASLLRTGGSAIAPEMLRPLLMMALGYMFYCAYVIMLRMKTIILQRRVNDALRGD